MTVTFSVCFFSVFLHTTQRTCMTWYTTSLRSRPVRKGMHWDPEQPWGLSRSRLEMVEGAYILAWSMLLHVFALGSKEQRMGNYLNNMCWNSRKIDIWANAIKPIENILTLALQTCAWVSWASGKQFSEDRASVRSHLTLKCWKLCLYASYYLSVKGQIPTFLPLCDWISNLKVFSIES